MNNALELLAQHHRHHRGAGQTHALIEGAVAWARSVSSGSVRIVTGDARIAHDVLMRVLNKSAPLGAVMRSAARSVTFPSGGVVRVATLDGMVCDGAGWNGPVLLDGSAVDAIARGAAPDWRGCPTAAEALAHNRRTGGGCFGPWLWREDERATVRVRSLAVCGDGTLDVRDDLPLTGEWRPITNAGEGLAWPEVSDE